MLYGCRCVETERRRGCVVGENGGICMSMSRERDVMHLPTYLLVHLGSLSSSCCVLCCCITIDYIVENLWRFQTEKRGCYGTFENDAKIVFLSVRKKEMVRFAIEIPSQEARFTRLLVTTIFFLIDSCWTSKYASTHVSPDYFLTAQPYCLCDLTVSRLLRCAVPRTNNNSATRGAQS